MSVAAWLAAAAVLASGAAAQQAVSVDVVSSPPDLVTTPGVLVRVRGSDLSPIGWASNDTLITPFYQNDDGDWFGLIGLMDLLIPGVNLVTVTPDQRRPTADITFAITVHAPDQPLFAGPRLPPGPCRNEAVGLAPAADASCAVERATAWVYRTTDAAWQRFPEGGPRSVDIATATTSGGRGVAMIVRVETGVINRVPYVIAFLDDPPTGPGATPGKPWPFGAWNGVLVYGAGDAFGLGVQGPGRVGFFDLGPASGTVSCAEALVADGYAVAVAQAAIGPAADDAVAAETLLRVRERFIKRFGLPRVTVGLATGAAGVALTRIAAAYPGLDAAGPDAIAGVPPGCR